MKRQKKAAAWAALLWVTALAACAAPVTEPEAMTRTVTPLAQMPQVAGEVLDATAAQLYLRTSEGAEYVFSLLGDEVDGDIPLAAGQWVTVIYQPDGTSGLSRRNSKTAKVHLVQINSAD